MWFKTLKSKILFLVLASVGGSMLLAGLSLGYFFSLQNEKQAKQIFNSFYHSAELSLQQLEQKLSKDVSILANNSALEASLNLISEYSSVENYQAIIFDKEKWDITQLLSNFARAAQISHIRVQDKSGWLVSFIDNEQEHLEEGIVTFKNKKPVFDTLSLLDKASMTDPSHSIWRSLIKVNVNIAERSPETVYLAKDDKAVYMRSSYPIYRTLPDNTKKYIFSKKSS